MLFDTVPKISSLAHVNKVINQIVRRDLGADLIHARENSNFRGVMYTNFCSISRTCYCKKRY